MDELGRVAIPSVNRHWIKMSAAEIVQEDKDDNVKLIDNQANQLSLPERRVRKGIN